MIENRVVGIKSRELYEAPAATDADRSAPGARGPRADEGRARRQARVRAEVGAARLRRPLVQPGARGDTTRSSPRRRSSSTARCGSTLQPGRPWSSGRRSEHALYAESLASYGDGRDLPPRGGGGIHHARGPRDGARGGSRGQEDGARMTLWSARVDGTLSPEVREFLQARRRRAAALRLRGDAAPRAPAPRGRAALRRGARTRSPSGSRRSSYEPGRRGRAHADRAQARRGRAQDPRRPLAERPGGGGAPALRRGRLRGGDRRDRGASRAPSSTRAEDEAETPMPGYTHLQRAQPVTVGHHLLAWVEMLERDRLALPLRRASRPRPSPLGAGALAGSTLRAAAAREPDAELARRRRRPRLRARLPLRVRRALRPPLADRRGALPLGLERVRLRRGCPRRRRRAPR